VVVLRRCTLVDDETNGREVPYAGWLEAGVHGEGGRGVDLPDIHQSFFFLNFLNFLFIRDFCLLGFTPCQTLHTIVALDFARYLFLSLFTSLASAAELEAGLREAGGGMGNGREIFVVGPAWRVGQRSLRAIGKVPEVLRGVYVSEQVCEGLGVCQECANRPCCSPQCAFHLSPLGFICGADKEVM